MLLKFIARKKIIVSLSFPSFSPFIHSYMPSTSAKAKKRKKRHKNKEQALQSTNLEGIKNLKIK
jgi:hypothetical protein